MKLANITSLKELKASIAENEDVFLLIYKSGSDNSECAVRSIQELEDAPETISYSADVNIVKDIHGEYGISSAPSLLYFNQGKLMNIYKGCQTAEFYRSLFSGRGFTKTQSENGKAAKRVTVYTTPTCTWCTTIKTYLKEHNINFTEVDVSSNPARAEEMVRKSGQQGVPQTDINGQVVVGFDKIRINSLLEI